MLCYYSRKIYLHIGLQLKNNWIVVLSFLGEICKVVNKFFYFLVPEVESSETLQNG